ncbi:MFS general substrate transporter [Biscogniauxia marginata]|nr:MFS general substrate transporter [Biscogniauxia marginata]
MSMLRQYLSVRESAREDLARCQSTQPNTEEPNVSIPDINDEKTTEKVPSGVTVSRPAEGDGAVTLLVGWKDNDPLNPQNWSRAKKWRCTAIVCLIAVGVCIPGTIDAPVSSQFNEHYRVGPVAGSLTTGLYLIGVGVGSMFAAPFSETFGRNLVYFTTMIAMMLFILAKALAPNFGGAIVFRFLIGFFGAAPLTVGGGTVGDLWNPIEVTFSLPFVTMTSYAGPVLGPIIGAYLPQIGFRWADWISLIIAGAVLIIALLFQPETHGSSLLEWKAKHLRDLSGDARYQVQENASTSSLGSRLLVNVYRPFQMTYTEPIILVFSFYLVILYVVLFTFLNGYPYIFTQVYGISESLTFIIWTAILAGDAVAVTLIPVVYGLVKKAAAKAAAEGSALQAEVCLYWAMMGGSILMPISLFWMGWTCYPNVSIWAPIIGSFVFGYSLVAIFTTTYMYIVFVYTVYAGSALSFMTFSRYVIAGALLPASVPWYNNLGPHWTLTIVGILSAIMAPVPFLLYKYGHNIRAMSKNVQNKA